MQLASDLQLVGVLGAGQMGGGIAQVLATHGISVRLFDIDQGAREQALVRIERSLKKLQSKGRLEEDPAAILARLHPAAELAELDDVEFAIEAVVEREDAKVDLLRQLHARLSEDVILASNTSSISITRMGKRIGRPARFIGMHFMNPAPLMKLVEVVIGLGTDTETVLYIEQLAERLQKSHVRTQDSPGFIVNRILLPMINEAITTLQGGTATCADIDQAMVEGTNQPMGPLALADLIGLDTVLAIMEVMHQTFGEDRYRPAYLLRQYVDAGYLGRKSGRGFYRYDGG